MGRLVTALVLLTASVAPGWSEPVKVFGAGNISCAKWLTDAITEAHGGNWILGFWSGANTVNSNGSVGLKTDSEGIVAAVKLKCAQDPGAALFLVVAELYGEFERKGR
jgi:hypothetical protein